MNFFRCGIVFLLTNPKYREHGIGAALGALSFLIYWITASRSIDVIDAGELAAIAYTLGIAHPTGYPVFSILGGLFTHLPLPIRVIFLTNLVSALFCAIAVYFFFRFLVFFLKEFALRDQEAGPLKDTRDQSAGFLRVMLPAICGSLVLAFSETFWAQATSVEVYSLHVAFLTLLLFLFSRAVSVRKGGGERYWLLFAYVLGMAFGNHMTTILLAPAFLFAFFVTQRFTLAALKRIGILAAPFLLGLSVYVYLPVRASAGPALNWGNPVTLERMLWHMSGKQYRVWLFSSTESATRQFEYFATTLPAEFAYVPLLLALAGIVYLFRQKRTVLAFTLLLFFGCVMYAINYDIHDIDSYFLLAYITLAVWSAAGVAFILSMGKWKTAIAAPVAIAVCLAPAFVNFSTHDESDFRLVEEYSTDMFKSLDPNAVIISYQWDYFVSASNYLQYVEGMRPDVAVIDKELLRRSWYYRQLEVRHPWLMERITPEVNALLPELYKFEHGLPYDNATIESRFAGVIRAIITKSLPDHPVYITPEIEQQYVQRIGRVPQGLAFRLYQTPEEYAKIGPVRLPDFHFSVPEKGNKYTDGILSMYGRAYFNAGTYHFYGGRNDTALALVNRSLEISQAYPEALTLRERLLSLKRQ